jgi:hypothetical protein
MNATTTNTTQELSQKEKSNARSRAYYEKNKEKIREYNQLYREANKEKIKEHNNIYNKANREKINERAKKYRKLSSTPKKKKVYDTPEYKKAYDKAYREANKEKIKQREKAYREANKEKIHERDRAYAKANKEKIRAYHQANREKIKEAKRIRYKNEPLYKAKAILRCCVSHAFKRIKQCRPANTQSLLGCTWEEAKAHFESLFQEGMSWENHGEWHIDHVRPVASFAQDELHLMNHISNLQPLWAKDNWMKGSNLL